MSKITELRRYKESDEFKKILKKCENRETGLCDKIVEAFDSWDIDNEALHSKHDFNNLRRLFNSERLSEVTDTGDGAKAVSEYLTDEVKSIEETLIKWILDTDLMWLQADDSIGFSTPLSNSIYTNIDLLRFKRRLNSWFLLLMDTLIAQEEKQDAVETQTLTSNDADKD